jgi:2-oxoglutarate ferredoxin oxidoreductase subunit beta
MNTTEKYGHPKSFVNHQTKYCAGCGHGIIQRILAELIDELAMREKTVITNPVGCAIWMDLDFDCDSVQPPHGRTPAAATGIKRVLKDHLVICYQGDGDIAAIGAAEALHAANRGERFTTVFVNNAIYGMTGGQMAPTTLIGQKAATAPEGRDPSAGAGYPVRMAELFALLDGTRYIARGSVHTPGHIRTLKKYLRTALRAQLDGIGSTIVEILAPCPTNWGMESAAALDWIEREMVKTFPLGEIKNTLKPDNPAGAYNNGFK